MPSLLLFVMHHKKSYNIPNIANTCKSNGLNCTDSCYKILAFDTIQGIWRKRLKLQQGMIPGKLWPFCVIQVSVIAAIVLRYICWAQSMDLCNPWIALRKVWIRDDPWIALSLRNLGIAPAVHRQSLTSRDFLHVNRCFVTTKNRVS